MAAFLSILGNLAIGVLIAAYILFMSWVIGNAIESALRYTIRDELREHEERKRRVQAESEGPQA